MRVFFPAMLAVFFLAACSGSFKNKRGLFDVDGEGGLLGSGVYAPNSRNVSNAPLGNEIGGVHLKDWNFDIPVVKNKAVEFWVNYYQGRGRKTFQRYINRYGKFAPLMRGKLRAAGMPEDLIFLAMVESGFAMNATSRARAVGPWQFMRATGKQYRLNADWWRDERRDPFKATDAAIAYLKVLYKRYGDWELCLAAYNAGEGKINRALRRHNTKSFWRIASTRSIRAETKNHIPKIMAAAIVTKNARAFGFKSPVMDNSWLQTKLVRLKKPEALSHIAKVVKVHPKVIRKLNPELKRWSTPPRNGFKVRVPSESSRKILVLAQKEGKLGKYRGFRRYRIRRGDTLSEIAQRSGTSIQPIMRINNLRSARLIRPGKELVLPIVNRRTRAIAQLKHKNSKPHLIYVVRRGDTLYGISRRYDVSIRDLKRWNSIYRHKSLRPGRQLRLYVSNVASKNI